MAEPKAVRHARRDKNIKELLALGYPFKKENNFHRYYLYCQYGRLVYFPIMSKWSLKKQFYSGSVQDLAAFLQYYKIVAVDDNINEDN